MDYLNLFFTSSEMIFRLVRFAAALIVGIAVTRIVASMLSKYVLDLSKYSAHRISNIIQLIGFTVALVIALEAGDFGNLLTVVGTIAAALTVAIGFGMRDEVANYVAGIFIHMQNPYVKGDYIKIGEEEGKVKEIGMRATRLNESTGGDVMVPNSKIDSNPVVNFTKGARNHSTITVTVANEKAERAAELLREAAEEAEKVLDKPAPETVYDEVGGEVTVRMNIAVRGSPLDTKSEVKKLFNAKAVEEKLFESDKEEK